MKRILVLGCMILLIAMVSGCHADEKQAAEIYKKMEKSASLEEEFAANQKELDENREKEQAVYEELIALDITDADTIEQKLRDAQKYTDSQQQLLEDTKQNFQTAYKHSTKVEVNLKKIRDSKQKKQVTKLLKLMNDRKQLIDSFFAEYQDQLDRQKTFYQQLEDKKFSADKLDQQIETMNEQSQEMEKLIQQFNQSTKQYNQTEEAYYKLAGLNQKHSELADSGETGLAVD
ncbi:YkyA family protein [Lentibacillus sp. N15]|uniref:YkyA family protein n=1 Tax=Lentibacillus songyuanensis TaxID=3136161 RepID=UPI0031BBC4D7